MPRPRDPVRRATILHAARKCFLEQGYLQARMADIATAANVAIGSLYVYFPSKEAIALALVEDYFSLLIEVLLPHVYSRDGFAAIATTIHAALTCAEQNQDILRLCRLDIGLENIPKRVSARDHLGEALANALAEQMDHGTFRRFDPHLLAQWIGGQIEWANEACFIHGTGDVASYEQMLTDLLQHALLPSLYPNEMQGK